MTWHIHTKQQEEETTDHFKSFALHSEFGSYCCTAIIPHIYYLTLLLFLFSLLLEQTKSAKAETNAKQQKVIFGHSIWRKFRPKSIVHYLYLVTSATHIQFMYLAFKKAKEYSVSVDLLRGIWRRQLAGCFFAFFFAFFLLARALLCIR